MTLEELTSDLAKLEAMSDKELLAWAEPFLKVTRPELQPKKEEKQKMLFTKENAGPSYSPRSNSNNLKKKAQDALELLAQLEKKAGVKI